MQKTSNVEPAADRKRATYFSFDEFDIMPRLIRDLINYAPVSVGSGFVFSQLRAGIDVEYVAFKAVQRWRRYARELALRDYGTSHPQAA